MVADDDGERLEVPIEIVPDRQEKLVIEYSWE